MAKLPEEATVTINSLKQQLLDILDNSTAVEFILFERFGETETTIPILEELKNVARSTSWFSRLVNLQLRIAQSQPTATFDMLKLLSEAILRIQAEAPAMERSIQEVKIDWNVP